MKKSGLEAGGSQKGPTETTPLVGKDGSGGGGDGGGSSKGGFGGLSVNQVALLIAGEMAGSGVLALPRALTKTGWVGVPIIIIMCVIAAFSGKRLGDCWSMVEARDPEMRSRQRTPYAIIANQALGKKWSVVVSMAMMATLFGAAVVYLLMAAQIIEEVLRTLVPTVTFCAWFLIVAGATTPLMMFTSPKDFSSTDQNRLRPYAYIFDQSLRNHFGLDQSFTGVIAFGSTFVACILYFIQMMNDIRPFPTFRLGIHGFQDFFLAFGTIMFAFGGASAFPTIQNDMADKSKFNKSLMYSFGAVLILYLPIAIAGYAIYGESVAPNLAASVTATPLTLVANILMAVHLIAAFTILINPVCQEAEELYNIAHDATLWRMGVRVSIMLAILFIGESIPRFYTILALVGGTTVALLTFVLPSLCYLKLSELPPAEGQVAVQQPGWMKMVCWEVIIIGAVGGIAATYSAVSAIFSTAQATPCYLK
ncbi:hypothetical protein JYU34_000678 [Plutella xylostella]|uniref:Amino acid transporter transmembrane domain-containing protein n=1 Tax=Plutella xylostella TaxID=51655 RepID=A0ABQ7R8B2_PLUXY|nr:hypothetical protein JYU34_000678 [Plutella xylostella]